MEILENPSKRSGSLKRKKSKAKDLKAVSNIHSLYQDLFITDMKEEIAEASSELL